MNLLESAEAGESSNKQPLQEDSNPVDQASPQNTDLQHINQDSNRLLNVRESKETVSDFRTNSKTSLDEEETSALFPPGKDTEKSAENAYKKSAATSIQKRMSSLLSLSALGGKSSKTADENEKEHKQSDEQNDVKIIQEPKEEEQTFTQQLYARVHTQSLMLQN